VKSAVKFDPIFGYILKFSLFSTSFLFEFSLCYPVAIFSFLLFRFLVNLYTMETKLAVPIAAPNLDEAKRQIKAAKAAGAEMLELRTDYLEKLTAELVKNLIAELKSAADRSGPTIIVTCRDKRQGGCRHWPDHLRTDVLAEALKAGADFIDFEYEKFLVEQNLQKIKQALSQNPKAKLILSAHNFKTKFDDISELYHRISTAHPAAIAKLVYTANHINDCFDAFDLLHSTAGTRIVFCMGAAGLISRVIAKKLGSFVTFASIDHRTATAPGQLTVGQFKNLFRADSINADTTLYGVIADPVAHSMSPAVHNTGFADIAANKVYLPLLVEGGKKEFDRFMDNIIARGWLGFAGFSVTIPHKQNALNYVKAKQGFVEPLAEKIGAVNTVLVGPDGKLSAYNTDYSAALNAITSKMGVTGADLNGLAVAVIGAGGVARALVAGLTEAGAKIKIYNRTVKKAEKLAADFNCDFAGLDELPKVNAKLLINCTSIGMHPHIEATPFPKQYLKNDMTVFDTVYNPAETTLLRQAKQAGAKTITGLEMFVNQALAQFRFFAGTDANAELMRKTVSKWLGP